MTKAHTVILSNEVFRQTVSAALEAYAVPHGKKQTLERHKPLETYGSIWGYITARNDHVHYHVVAADVETSAHRRNNSVRRKVGSTRIKGGFYMRYHPELGYLGDFHSHPYSEEVDKVGSAQEAENGGLYRFSGTASESTEDYGHVKSLMEEDLKYRVGIVVTVYEMKYVKRDHAHKRLDKGSAVRFTHTGPGANGKLRSYRCWLKCYVFNGTDPMPFPDGSVRLQCPSLGVIA